MIVIADATPLNYLVLIGHSDILPKLFDQILIPSAVMKDLEHLGAGEREAIFLAEGTRRGVVDHGRLRWSEGSDASQSSSDRHAQSAC